MPGTSVICYLFLIYCNRSRCICFSCSFTSCTSDFEINTFVFAIRAIWLMLLPIVDSSYISLLPVLMTGRIHISTIQCHRTDIGRWCHSCSRCFLLYLSTLTLRYPDAHCRSWCLSALWSAHTHPSSRVILLICFAVIVTLSVFRISTSAALEIPVT